MISVTSPCQASNSKAVPSNLSLFAGSVFRLLTFLFFATGERKDHRSLLKEFRETRILRTSTKLSDIKLFMSLKLANIWPAHPTTTGHFHHNISYQQCPTCLNTCCTTRYVATWWSIYQYQHHSPPKFLTRQRSSNGSRSPNAFSPKISTSRKAPWGRRCGWQWRREEFHLVGQQVYLPFSSQGKTVELQIGRQHRCWESKEWLLLRDWPPCSCFPRLQQDSKTDLEVHSHTMMMLPSTPSGRLGDSIASVDEPYLHTCAPPR